jgi:hypothetical protein
LFDGDTYVIGKHNQWLKIDYIEVGSWVLSQNEKTGEQAYRRVTKKFEHHAGLGEPEFPLYAVDYITDTGTYPYRVYVTFEHLFWVNSIGWVPANELKPVQWLEICDPNEDPDQDRPEGAKCADFAMSGKRWQAMVVSAKNLFIISGNGGKPLPQSAESGISERIPRLSERVRIAAGAINERRYPASPRFHHPMSGNSIFPASTQMQSIFQFASSGNGDPWAMPHHRASRGDTPDIEAVSSPRALRRWSRRGPMFHLPGFAVAPLCPRFAPPRSGVSLVELHCFTHRALVFHLPGRTGAPASRAHAVTGLQCCSTGTAREKLPD